MSLCLSVCVSVTKAGYSSVNRPNDVPILNTQNDQNGFFTQKIEKNFLGYIPGTSMNSCYIHKFMEKT